MKLFFLLFTLFSSLLSAKYLTNESCKECHEDIYYEYKSSYHAKTYFNDELHRKVANVVNTKKYECASCHMPAAQNIKALENGEKRLDETDVQESDAISCFFCHQIGYVKEAHEKDIIYVAKKPAGYKPAMFGSLKNPDESDKHEMLHNPIYKKNVCLGCHSHKRNTHDVMVFNAIKNVRDTTECIQCHMPYINGGAEKTNKRARTQHHSHTFSGIHSIEMRKKAVDIALKIQDTNTLHVTLTNKMSHPLIIQAARMKYVEIKLLRDGKVIWKNFSKTPLEDKQGCFVIEFADKQNNPVAIPAFAYKRAFVHNLEAKESQTLIYHLPSLQKGDSIEVSLFVILAKPSCQKVLDLQDNNLKKPLLMRKVTLKI